MSAECASHPVDTILCSCGFFDESLRHAPTLYAGVTLTKAEAVEWFGRQRDERVRDAYVYFFEIASEYEDRPGAASTSSIIKAVSMYSGKGGILPECLKRPAGPSVGAAQGDGR